jgi:hypothetical protein
MKVLKFTSEVPVKFLSRFIRKIFLIAISVLIIFVVLFLILQTLGDYAKMILVNGIVISGWATFFGFGLGYYNFNE